MGLFGALFSGVSGLRAQGVSLATISDNIANVSTVGYKETTTHFSSFVTGQTSRFSYSAGGVRAVPTALIDRQGELEGSASSTDLAISGDGFFVVGTSNVVGEGELRYTRAGSFTVDREGNLVNTSGHYLMGWPTDNQGEPVVLDTTTTAQLELININNLLNAAVSTSEFSLGANLPSNTTVGDSHTAAATVFDGFGVSHGIPLTFTRQPTFTDDIGRVHQNVWNLSSRAPEGASVIRLEDNEGNTFAASGRLDFNAIPEDGEILTIGTLTFEFDSGDGVEDGNISIPLSQINSVQDAKNLLVNAYRTSFGRFEGSVNVALANELDTQGGRFSSLPNVIENGPGNISEATLNTLQAAFEEGTDDLSLDLRTNVDSVRLAGKTNLAFGINNENIDDESFGRDSADLSNVRDGDAIRIYVRNITQAGGPVATEVARIVVGAGGIEAGIDGQTTVGAITIDGFDYEQGGYQNLVTDSKTAAVTTGIFDGTVDVNLQNNQVSAAAAGELEALLINDTLSLDLLTTAPNAGDVPNTIAIDGRPGLAFQVFDDRGAEVGGNTRLGFGNDSIDLSNLGAGNTVGVFVNDGAGTAVRVATIELNRALRLGDAAPGEDAFTTNNALQIGGFTYDAVSEGYTGLADITVAGTAGGFFGANTPAIASVPTGIPESVRSALVQTGHLTDNNVLSFDLQTVGGEVRLARVPNISYRVVDAGGVVIGGAENAYDVESPDLAGVAANTTIELYVDSNGNALRGDPVRIATLTLQNPLTAGVNGGLTQNALQIENFAAYTSGGFTDVGVPAVSGVTPRSGGDFPDGTTAILPDQGVSPFAEGILNSLGGDIFNDVTRVLNLGLRTIADPSGGNDRQTHIAPVRNLAFVHNPGGSNPTPPLSGLFPGAFGQPSVDLTQGVAADDTIDIYADTGAEPTLVAQIRLPRQLDDVGTQAGQTTPNALQIGGFVYETDERLRAGTGVDNNTVFFEQNQGEGTVNFDASGILSVDQDRAFVVPAIVTADPPNVIFTGTGVPNSFNLSNAVVQWSNGADDSVIAVDLGTPGGTGALTQYDDTFNVRFVRQDGVPSGSISGVEVGESGTVLARFDNGRNQPIYRLPLATFPNVNALGQDSGNVYSPTSGSGEPLLGIPGIGATGRIAQNSLETSTVDIANEFSRMIITQRAFSAASRVVTTSDEMLDELVRIKR